MLRRTHSGFRPAAGNPSKVMLIQIAEQVRLTSNGSTTWIQIDIDLEELRWLGPWLESIVVVTNTVGATANHAWKVQFAWSVEGRNWSAAIDLFLTPGGIVAGSGAAIQPVYTDTTKFGPQMKYILAVRSASAGAVDTACVDAWLQLTFKS